MIPGCTTEGGDIAGMNNLATCYANGTGVAINPGHAMHLYRQAARAGYSIAQHNLGGVYCKGQIIPRDLKLAVMWYKRATAQGVYQSDYWLGVIYEAYWTKKELRIAVSLMLQGFKRSQRL